MIQREKFRRRFRVPFRASSANCGFTLLEMIMVIAVFALVLTATSELFITIYNVAKKTNNIRKIQQDARYALETISREARLAKTTNVDKTNNIITTTSKDNIQIEFKLSSGKIIMTSPPGGTSQNLTTDSTNILTFNVDDNVFSDCSNNIQPFFKLTIEAEAKEASDRTGTKPKITLSSIVSKRNYYEEKIWNWATDKPNLTTGVRDPGGRYRHTAIWTGTEMIIWGGSVLNGDYNDGARYNPTTDTWVRILPAYYSPSYRGGHTAVWTGETGNPATANQMIIWGGNGGAYGGDYYNDGARYNPATNTWTPTSTTNAPSARTYHTAVWTGTEMIIWGGYNAGGQTNSGARYNPATNTWTSTSFTNAPSARDGHTAVWTGETGNPATANQMIIWGGSGYLNTGGRYNPTTNTWTSTTITNAPSGREDFTAVWTGTEMIIWGGWGCLPPCSGSRQTWAALNTGARYNPATNTWTPTTTTGAPPGKELHTAVWTGTEMIIWGGNASASGTDYVNDGSRYNPCNDTWIPTSATNVPAARRQHTAIWTGKEMIIWGGWFYIGVYNNGGSYRKF